MHIQNLDKFYKRVLKILSGNEKIMMDEGTDERNDRQPKSYMGYSPPFKGKGKYSSSQSPAMNFDRSAVH